MLKAIDYITEKPREIPVWYDVDVLVCGAGPSGIAAAVCAGRAGLSVVMTEMTSHPGGQTNNVTWLNDFKNKGGFAKEWFSNLSEAGEYERPYYNPFILIPYYDKLLTEANVRPLYLVTAVAPILEENRLCGVIFETKSGRGAVRAKIVIDATGDGDIAKKAGAHSLTGRASDGATQAISLASLLLDWNGVKMDSDTVNDIVKGTGEKLGINYKLPYDRWSPKPVVGIPSVNLQAVPHATGYDPTDAESLSDALIELRRQTAEMVKILSENNEFAQVKLGPFNALPGVRESRRIVTEKIITREDALSGARFDDGLFIVSQNIDIHKRTDKEPSITVEHIIPYHFPYGALIPKGLENILVVGRCIGGEHEALASYRVIADCLSMGEAAAQASRMAITSKCSLREINIDELKEYMSEKGYLI